MATRGASPSAAMATKQRVDSGGHTKLQRSSANRLAGQDIAGVTKVVDAAELARIKKRAVIMTDDDVKHMKQEHEQHLSATRHESDERKRRMMEKELAVRARREQSALEMEMAAEQKALLTPETIQRNQHLVSIRRIQSLALQATGYQLCDELQGHTKARAAMEVRYERVHDAIMARDCETELEVRKQRAAEAHATRIEAREMLEQQIAARQKQAIWDEEAKAIEAQKIVATYKQYEVEAQAKIAQQHVLRTRVQQDVAQTNARIQEMKQLARLQEQREDLAAAAYNRKKALADEAAVAEAQRVRRANEMRVAKLRAQQERAQDKQALTDAKRAKQASEAAEMERRNAEAQARAKQLALAQSIANDRMRHVASRTAQQQMQQQAELAADRHAQLLADHALARDRAQAQAKTNSSIAYGHALQQQIGENKARHAKAAVAEQTAGAAAVGKKVAARDCIVAEKVRIATLERLERQGVPEEYLRELVAMRITESNV